MSIAPHQRLSAAFGAACYTALLVGALSNPAPVVASPHCPEMDIDVRSRTVVACPPGPASRISATP